MAEAQIANHSLHKFNRLNSVNTLANALRAFSLLKRIRFMG
jgi:hypothetical protein